MMKYTDNEFFVRDICELCNVFSHWGDLGT